MYIHPGQQFAHSEELLSTIEDYPFATLICGGESPLATHLPFVLERSGGEGLELLGHTPRNDPIWRRFDGATEMLTIFLGPYAYVSPAWYVDGARVPTYNFKVVHAYGRPAIMQSESEVMQALRRLVEQHEGASNSGWSFEDIPSSALAALRPAIVPFRLRIERLEGKIRVGQNRSLADRNGVIRGLRARGRPYDAAVAAMMESGPIDATPTPLLRDIPSDIIGGRDLQPSSPRR